MVMTATLPQRPVEAGRIRIGHREANKRGGGTHPAKLDKFRLTSKHHDILAYAANHPDIGGEVRAWADAPGEAPQWELYTETACLKVIVPTLMAVSLSFEKWRGGYCTWRCDGKQVLLDADHAGRGPQPCPCETYPPPCGAERHLRLNVYLMDVPGWGVWRLDSGGYYATAELVQTFQMLHEAGVAHTMIEGTLRLEQRQRKTLKAPDGSDKAKPQTFDFAVPVFWPIYTPRELLTGASNVLMLGAGAPKQLPAPAQTPQMWEDDTDESETYNPLVEEITAYLTNHGWSEAKIAATFQRMKAANIPLEEGYAKLQSAIAVQEAKSQPQPEAQGETTQETQVVEPEQPVLHLDLDWRETLQQAVQKLSHEDLEHNALRLEATALLENPEATDAQGEAMHKRVMMAVQELARSLDAQAGDVETEETGEPF